MGDGQDAERVSLAVSRRAGPPRRRETATAALQRRDHELAVLNAIAQALNREVDLAKTARVTLATRRGLIKLASATPDET